MPNQDTFKATYEQENIISEEEILLTMALASITNISFTAQKQLLDTFGTATRLYHERANILDIMPEANPVLRDKLTQMDTMLPRCREEYEWTKTSSVECIPYASPRYPSRLRDCNDAPIMLYYRGNADLNSPHILSMVGTRKITDYGKLMCQRIIREIKQLVPDTIIVSGLAYGVDIHCHRAALDLGMPTIGILAHGLNQIYPQTHRQTAIHMANHGGLLTEFPSTTHIDKRNFVQRNRIVAGMSDAVIVIESAAKGGSLITAELALDYCKDVFAVPGRLTDTYSAGTNRIISDQTAHAITSGEDIIKNLGWEIQSQQLELDFGNQSSTTRNPSTTYQDPILSTLSSADTNMLSISDLSNITGIPVGPLRGQLLSLEMKGLIRMLPGNRCTLV